MPKEQRVPNLRFNPNRASPYPRRPAVAEQQQWRDRSRTAKDVKEWEEARCPICMEHPHNAVLLNCSSHDKGCRPYICDTSQRHSNCLDQFCKSFGTSSTEQLHRTSQGHGHEVPNLLCPLCRGDTNGWAVLEPAREFMNAKTRSCSCEGCNFVGTYQELRKHARSEHPLSKPTEVDPERELNWMRLQEELERDDLMQLQEEEWEMSGIEGMLEVSISHEWLTRSNPGSWRYTLDADDLLLLDSPGRIDTRQSNNSSSPRRRLSPRPLPMRASRTRSDTGRNLRHQMIPERYDDDRRSNPGRERMLHTRQSNYLSSRTRRNLRPGRIQSRHEYDQNLPERRSRARRDRGRQSEAPRASRQMSTRQSMLVEIEIELDSSEW